MMPEYFEFYNPVKIMCGEAALENIPYELTRLGAHKIFVLISRTMLNDGILERIIKTNEDVIGIIERDQNK